MNFPSGLEFWVSTAKDQHGRCVVTVIGELDAATAPRLRAEVTKAIEGEAGEVEIDLRGCSFVDSSGIATLVWTAMRLGERDRTLLLIGARERVRRILELSGVAGHGSVVLGDAPEPNAG